MSFVPPARVAQRFWAFLRPYRSRLGIAACGNLFTVTVSLLTPLLVKYEEDNKLAIQKD